MRRDSLLAWPCVQPALSSYGMAVLLLLIKKKKSLREIYWGECTAGGIILLQTFSGRRGDPGPFPGSHILAASHFEKNDKLFLSGENHIYQWCSISSQNHSF